MVFGIDFDQFKGHESSFEALGCILKWFWVIQGSKK